MNVAQLDREQLAKVVRVGVDLAKTVYAICGVDRHERVVIKKMMKRKAFEQLLSSLPAGCVVAMEACGGAHAWGRQCQSLGLKPMLLAPQAVKPYIGEQKNDLRDACGICEAAGRPKMVAVRVKTETESDLQMIVRSREGRVADRTAKSNQIRGFLLEYGISVPMGVANFKGCIPRILEDAQNGLSARARQVLNSLHQEWLATDALVAEADSWLVEAGREQAACQRLQTIPGIGPVTALALLALLGDGLQFANGRAVAAWLGLTPRQHSSGGKSRLGRMTKHGQTYVRTLLIHGARAALIGCKAEDDRLLRWARALAARIGMNKAAVALANKLARIAWRLCGSERTYQPA